MYRVRWPCASRSMSRTRWPISASAAPRLTAVVVLPTPPFCIATAIVRAKSAPSLTEPDLPDWAGLTRRSSEARHLEWRPTCDHRHPCRPGPGDRTHHRLPARRNPTLDGRDLLFRHVAGRTAVPRPVHDREAKASPPDTRAWRVGRPDHRRPRRCYRRDVRPALAL